MAEARDESPEHITATDSDVDDEERRLTRRWFEIWRDAGPELMRIRAAELRAMTDDDARRAAAAVLAMARYSPPKDATSGLVEQQRMFARARR